MTTLVGVLAIAAAALGAEPPADSPSAHAVTHVVRPDRLTALQRNSDRMTALSRTLVGGRPQLRAIAVPDRRAQAQLKALRRQRQRAQQRDRPAEPHRQLLRRQRARAQQARQAAKPTATPAPAPASGDPRQIAAAMLSSHGWDSSQFSCLDALWVSESGWNVYAANAYSGAYGIPQALPAEKMATAGADWRTNPATQISWGLNYISQSYGSPCGAWAFKQANNWY